MRQMRQYKISDICYMIKNNLFGPGPGVGVVKTIIAEVGVGVV